MCCTGFVTVTIRQATVNDLEAMAHLGADCQSDPDFHIPYLGMDADSIATDIGELEDWLDTSVVAEDESGIVGWMVGEVDREMGRLWWWGPFVSGGQPWAEIADRLYVAAREIIPEAIAEEEACADDRSEPMRQWCARHRLESNPASVLLRCERSEAPVDARIRPLAAADHQAVMTLHDKAFPGTHTTAAALVKSDHPRLIIEIDDGVVGYVAFELQSDGSGYIDYLAVDEGQRGAGLGGALVDQACHDMFADGAVYAHLTVREDNAAARALYARLGFAEERLARPYRLGFYLP